MTLVVKSIVAFCIGMFVLAAVQTAGLFSLKQYLQSEHAMTAGVPVMGAVPNYAMSGFKESGFKDGILAKLPAIDTTTGQRLAVEGVARRTDMQIRAAQSAVPMPIRIPGMPR
jgi:hypothetical protein